MSYLRHPVVFTLVMTGSIISTQPVINKYTNQIYNPVILVEYLTGKISVDTDVPAKKETKEG